MKHVFALLAFALMSSGLAQFPNYLPTDELVAWYGFNSHLEELTANGEPVEVFDLDFGPDRFNVDQHSLQFNGSSSRAIIDWELIDLNAEYTLQVWALSTNQTKTFQCVVNSVPHNGFGLSYNWGGNGTYSIWGGDGETWNICSQCLSQVPINAGEWNHLVYRRESDSLELWINGVMASQVSDIAGDEEVVMAKAWVGATSLNNEFFEGLIDDLGVWQRALTQEEILALYDAPAPTFGCLDASACNYDPTANTPDGSCEYGACHCLDGTIWSDELGGCVVANPSDTDFDGCVGMIDLLDLLSSFGTCVEVPWACGDPLGYQGYDYATVQIGQQCWFAENLRSENYLNGDAILSNLSGDEWSTVNVGAVATFGEGESNCYNYSPNGDACNETWALSEYGRLYNWHATVDDRGLCPTDWYVSSDSDWLLLMEFLGGSFEAEMAMKTNIGWSNSGDGSNSSGFSGLPGGQRSNNLGNFNLSGTHGFWWSSSTEGMDAVGYYLNNLNEGLIRISEDPRYGSSVRCIHDSE